VRRLFPAPAALLALSLAAGALSACSFFEAPSQMRGNHVSADQLKELVPGTTTQADVTSLIGSPTAKASFDNNKWIYIGEVTRPRIGRVQGVESQDVVVLTFNDAGVLQNVEHLTQKNSLPVNVVSRTTPSPGSEASILQQLLGNVGRFSPGMGGGTNVLSASPTQ
jgi:outer membrane protein assembly factor BamE (lipoprotein component of BamABCDE complex)